MVRNLVIFIVVAVFLLAQGPQAFSTARSWLGLSDWDWRRDAVTSPERAKELAAKGLREQLISFNDGMGSIEYRYGAKADDQRYNIYAIGVGQLTLNEPESAGTEKVTVTGTRAPEPKDMPDADALPTYPITGQFNNVLIFDRRTGEMTKLFDTRLAISQFQYGWRTKPEVLVIFATDRDTDKDGKLSDGDLHDIYVYTFADRQMHKVAASHINPTEIMDIPDADYIVVKALMDRDEDGNAAEYGKGDYMQRINPFTLLRVDLKTFTASSFVPDKMLGDLQTTLDGPKAPAATSEPPASAQEP